MATRPPLDRPPAGQHPADPIAIHIARRLGWGDRRAMALALGIAVIAASGVVAALFYSPGDLDGFRWPMAELALHGHPLLVYTVHVGQWRSDDGPVGLVPLTAVAALANALGWQDSIHLRADLTIALFGVFSLLLAREAVLAVEAAHGRLRHPLATAAPFLLAPPLWIGIVGYGHVDLPIELWLTLLCVRLLGRDAPLRAGLCIGLALLTRTTVLLPAIPLTLVLVSGRRFRSAAWFVGVAAVTVAAGLLPFVIADTGGVIRSLVTYRADVPTLGGSFWQLLQGTPWAGFALRWDTLSFGGAALILTAAAVWRRPGASFTAPRVYALLAISSACLPLFAKSVWPYYLVDPYVFATLWWLGRPESALNWRAACPALLAACAVVLAIHPPAAAGAKVTEGVDCSLAVALVMALLLADWLRTAGRPGPRPRDVTETGRDEAAPGPVIPGVASS